METFHYWIFCFVNKACCFKALWSVLWIVLAINLKMIDTFVRGAGLILTSNLCRLCQETIKAKTKCSVPSENVFLSVNISWNVLRFYLLMFWIFYSFCLFKGQEMERSPHSCCPICQSQMCTDNHKKYQVPNQSNSNQNSLFGTYRSYFIFF